MKKLIKKLAPIIAGNRKAREAYGADFFAAHNSGQSPWLTLVTCCDSRVQPHLFLEEPINQAFTVEGIGNAVASSAGSIDYGIRHLHTPVLMIVGHSDCGAVKACLAGYEKEGADIQNALDPVGASLVGGRGKSLKDNIRKNIDHQVSVALEKYGDLVKDDKLLVVGAYYDFADDFGGGPGRLYFVNLNGIKDRELIAAQLEDALGSQATADL